MALSNLNKDNLDRLFSMLNINYNENNNLTNSIKNEYVNYAKLQMIAKQMEFLKLEAQEILNNYDFNNQIKEIECKFKKVPGTYYYCYNHNNKKIISLISNEESNIFDEYICKLYYDYDYNFYIVNE